MAIVRGGVAEIVARLLQLTRRVPRAVVALGVARDGSHEALKQAVSAAMAGEGVGVSGWAAVHLAAEGGAADEAQRLNRSRDPALASFKVILLTAGDEAALRALRAATVDLTSVVDLAFEVVPEAVAGDAEALVIGMRRVAMEESAVLDLTGLLASHRGGVRMRVERLYMPLVNLGRSLSALAVLFGSKDPLATARFEAERDARRLLIVGQPGSGKTTCLRHLAQEYSTGADPLGWGPRVPVLISLAAFAHAREGVRADLPLLDFVATELAGRGVEGVAALSDITDRLLLLLDGLDEVRGVEVRRQILDEVQRVFAAHAVSVVVTARFSALDELTAKRAEGFRTVRVRPPSGSDIATFVSAFFRERGTADPERDAHEVLTRIQGDPELGTLAQTPLLLVFLALMHELEGRIPDRRFVLFQRMAEILLDRWERARARVARRPGVRPAAMGDAKRVFGAFAWWAVESGQAVVSTDELRAALVRAEIAQGSTLLDAEARCEAVVGLLVDESAMLVVAGPGQWRFVHATLAEYFAGVEAARGGARWSQVLADVYRADWSEVVVFAAGELGGRGDVRLDELGRALLGGHPRGGRYGANNPGLLGAVLREDPGFSVPLTEKLVERFVKFCLGHVYWPRSREVVADHFAELSRVAEARSWGPAFRAALTEAVADPKLVDPRRAEVLGRLGPVLRSYNLPVTALVAALCAAEDEGLKLAGWQNRFALTERSERPTLLAYASALLPGVHPTSFVLGVRDLDDATLATLVALGQGPPTLEP